MKISKYAGSCILSTQKLFKILLAAKMFRCSINVHITANKPEEKKFCFWPMVREPIMSGKYMGRIMARNRANDYIPFMIVEC